ERHRSGHDLDEDWSGVAVPAALAAWLKDDTLNGEVECGLGLDLDVPIARDALDVEIAILGVAERGAAEERRRRAGARGEGWRTRGRIVRPGAGCHGIWAVATSCQNSDEHKSTSVVERNNMGGFLIGVLTPAGSR